MRSFQAKMDNVKENPEAELEAGIEALRKIKHRIGWS